MVRPAHHRLIVRATSTQITVKIVVTDLHSVTPSSFLEVCGASIHAMSYQVVG